MALISILNNKRVKYAFITLSTVIILYTFLHIYVFATDPILSIFKNLNDFYLQLSLKSAFLFLNLFGAPPVPSNHSEIFNPLLCIFYAPEVRYKKLAAIVFILVWLTRSPLRKKTFGTFLVIIVHFFTITLYNTYGLCLSPLSDHELVISIPDTIAYLLLFTCLVVWYYNNKTGIKESLSKLKINVSLFEKKIAPLFIIIYIYIILVNFIFDFFQFSPWINFLFISSQKILSLSGIDSTVDGTYLIGVNRTIYMAKFCLGINTLYLFASVVYLTGRRNMEKWLFIIGGIVFLNFINILRFVFLFIHVQKYGEYIFQIDLHDLFNYIIYSIVFILWVIWFENFSDMKFRNKQSVK